MSTTSSSRPALARHAASRVLATVALSTALVTASASSAGAEPPAGEPLPTASIAESDRAQDDRPVAPGLWFGEFVPDAGGPVLEWRVEVTYPEHGAHWLLGPWLAAV